MAKQYLYRADTRAPNEIFNSGFSPRYAGGIQIQAGGQMIGGVSTTRNLKTAIKYAEAYGGHLYLLHADGIDLLQKEIESKNTFAHSVISALGYKKHNIGTINNLISQAEIACERVPSIDVLCAREVITINGVNTLGGPLVVNDRVPDDIINHHARSVEWAILALA
ncbi:hypothetical protein [Pseudomonas avellanae]|uniref:hypothetical protein n=1 Tax=Pseudomonas avellanae TaxID=46257 RepID=UPI001186A9D3|nr:hypothetical protein [Pseudomonas avellanae]